ncbi:MAG TPA: heparinase II/III family protein [Gemmatimonadaceae bacterium]|nr:heparinase II/III family protein [Gemmatimonadaceae bacterium]
MTRLLDGEVARRVRAGASLRDVLAAGADDRFPLRHLRGRAGAPPDAPALLEEARATLAGEWTVFGRRAAHFARTGDWRADPVDGRALPLVHWTRVPYMASGGDVKLTWEHSRHHALVRLAQAYHLTGEERFAEAAVQQVAAWSAQNPPRRGVNWTSSLEVAFRAIAWCWIWQLTHRSPAWTEARTATLAWQLWHHARHVERYDSVHHSPNTHLTGEALGLLYVGTVFPGLRRARRWREFGTAILLEEIEHQFLADGFHYERAVGYHRYHLEFYLHALLLLQSSGAEAALLERIRAPLADGFAAAAALVRPDGSWPVFGDEDGGSTLRLAAAPVTDLAPLLAMGAALVGDPRLVLGRDPSVRALAWWLSDDRAWAALESMSPGRPESASATLPATGYLVARDDWSPDAWYCAVDVGPHGGDATGHAHTDLAHVEIARGATRLVVDPGSLTYTGDPAHRAWHRSEAAHARPTVEGVPLAEPAGPFAWRRVAPTPAWESSDDGRIWQCRLHYAHDHDGRHVAHERQVVLIRHMGVLVCDWLELPGARASWHWPIGAPPAGIALAPGRLDVAGLALHWRVAPAAPDAPELVERLFSPSYGVAEPGAVLSVGSAATERAIGLACAMDAAAAPVLEIEGDLARCTVDEGGTRTVVRFERGKRVNVTMSAAMATDAMATVTSEGTR